MKAPSSKDILNYLKVKEKITNKMLTLLVRKKSFYKILERMEIIMRGDNHSLEEERVDALSEEMYKLFKCFSFFEFLVFEFFNGEEFEFEEHCQNSAYRMLLFFEDDNYD